jgi:hypothetical protein
VAGTCRRSRRDARAPLATNCKKAPNAAGPSGAPGTIDDMWQVTVVCSDCDGETEVVVENLDDVDREACPCGYSYVVLSVAEFEAVHAEQGEVVQFPRRRKLPKAA